MAQEQVEEQMTYFSPHVNFLDDKRFLPCGARLNFPQDIFFFLESFNLLKKKGKKIPPSHYILKIQSLKLQLPWSWQGPVFLLGSSLLLCTIGISLQLPWCFQACAEIPGEGRAEASQAHFSRDLSRCLVGKVQSWGSGVGRTALELCGDRGDTTVSHLGSSSALT